MMNFPELPIDRPMPNYLLNCDYSGEHGICEGEDYYQSEHNYKTICAECASNHEDFLEFAGFVKKTASAWDLEMEALDI